MSTPNLVNSTAVQLVREAVHEVDTRDGLEALLLVLEKMNGQFGFVTEAPLIASVCVQIQQKIARLTSQTHGTLPSQGS